MSDAVFFALAGFLAAAMVALALVWPQGLGERSPAPFGHAVVSEQLEGPTPPPALPPAFAAAPLSTTETTEAAAHPATAPAPPAPATAPAAEAAKLKGAL